MTVRRNGFPLAPRDRRWLAQHVRRHGLGLMSRWLQLAPSTIVRAAAGAACYWPTHEAVRGARR